MYTVQLPHASKNKINVHTSKPSKEIKGHANIN